MCRANTVEKSTRCTLYYIYCPCFDRVSCFNVLFFGVGEGGSPKKGTHAPVSWPKRGNLRKHADRLHKSKSMIRQRMPFQRKKRHELAPPPRPRLYSAILPCGENPLFSKSAQQLSASRNPKTSSVHRSSCFKTEPGAIALRTLTAQMPRIPFGNNLSTVYY